MSSRWLREIGRRLGMERQQRAFRHLRLEGLEDRRVMAANPFPGAIDLDLTQKPQFSVVGIFQPDAPPTVYHVRNASGPGSESVRVIGFVPGQVDYQLEAFDLHGTPIAANDNSGGTDEPALTFDRFGHEEFFVRVTGQRNPTPSGNPSNPTSEYFVRFAPYQDDHAAVPRGTPVLLGGATFPFSGAIETLGDSDAVQFRATTTGSVAVHAVPSNGGPFDPNLVVRDSRNVVVAQNDNRGAGSLESRLSFPVQAGEVYTISVSASAFTIPSGATGGYQVTVTPFADAIGDTPDRAKTVFFDGKGEVSVSGTLENGADRDIYRFVVPATGVYRIEATTGPRAGLPIVSLTREDGTELGVAVDDRLTRFTAHAGEVIFARVESDSLTGLPFDLRVSALPDDGNNSTSGTYLGLAPTGPTVVNSTIGVAGDVDIFDVIPAGGGVVTVSVVAAFPTRIEVMDENGRFLANGDSSATFTLPEGVHFSVMVTAVGRSTGAYQLTVSKAGEAVPDTIDQAVPLVLSSGNATRDDVIDSPGDEDLFRIVAPASGTYEIRLRPLDNGVPLADTVLTLLDSNGDVIASNDDADYDSGDLSSRIAIELVANQTYFIRAAGFENLAGTYRLTVARDSTGVDTVGNDLATTAPLAPVGRRFEIADAIQPGDSGDVFRFVAPSSGTYRFRLQGAIETANPLADPLLTLFDSDPARTVLARNDDRDGLDSRFEANLIAGRTYFVRAEGCFAESGFYRLIIDDPNEVGMPTSRPLTLDAFGNATITDRISLPGGMIDFYYRATFTGTLVVRQEAATGSSIDSIVRVFESTGELIGRDDDSGGSADSELFFDVVAGRDYVVRACAYGATTGAFVLQLSRSTLVDDFGNSIDKARPLVLGGTPTQLAVVNGVIERGGDVDWFSFVAPRTGTLEILQEAAYGSPLDSFLRVATSPDGRSFFEDDDSGGGLNSAVTLEVVQGRTYYIRAGSYQQGRGAYRVTIRSSPDEYGDTPATARFINVNAPGAGAIEGSLQRSADVDVFAFSPEEGGSFEIRAFAIRESRIVPELRWIAADGRVLGSAIFTESGEAVLTVSAAAGETVYFSVRRNVFGDTLSADQSAYRIGAIQRYRDEAPNRISPHAPTIPLDANGFGERVGSLQVLADEDYFQIRPDFDGEIDVLMRVEGTAFLDALVEVFDVDGNLLASFDESGSPKPLDSRRRFEVEAGATYFIRATSLLGNRDETTVGDYRLLFQRSRTAASLDASLNAATSLDINPGGAAGLNGSFAGPGDTLSYAYSAVETGTFTVTVAPTGNPELNPILSVYRYEAVVGRYVLVGRNDNSAPGSTTSAVTFNALAGDRLFFHVDTVFGGVETRRGAFRLEVEPMPFADPVPFDPAGAQRVILSPSGTGRIQGRIETVFDEDRFRLTPASSNFYLLYSDDSTTLTANVRLFDDFGNEVFPAFFVGGGFAPVYFLDAGRDYDVLVGSVANPLGGFDEPRTTGAYSLTFRPNVDDHSDLAPTPVAPVPAGATPSAIALTSVSVLSTGTSGIVGLHENDTDIDFFSYTASATGQVRIVVSRVGLEGNLAAPELAVFGSDSLGNQFASFDPVTGMATLTREVAAGETLRIATGGFGGAGLYRLTVGDPGGNGFDDATSITLDDRLANSVRGEINDADDLDTFHLIAPRTGTLRITLTSDLDLLNSSGFEPGLVRLFASGQVVESTPTSSFNRRVLILDVTEGEEIVLRASTRDGFTGGYTLQLAYSKAETSIGGPTVRNFIVRVDPESRIARFAINPSDTGVIGLTVVPRDPGADGQVAIRVLDGDLGLIGRSLADVVQRESRLQYNVRAGEATIVELEVPAGAISTTGEYVVQVLLTPGGSVPSAPSNVIQPIAVSPRPTESLIPQAGTTQVRSFVATASGLMTLEFHSPTPLLVGIWDSQNNLLATSTTADSQLSFQATARETYFLRVRAPDDVASLAGNFTVQLRPDDRPATPSSPMVLPPNQTMTLPGNFQTPGDLDAVGLTVGGTNGGTVTIRFVDSPGRGLDPTVQLIGLAGGAVTFTREITFRVAAGTELSLILSGAQAGKFDLLVSFVEDGIAGIPEATPPGDGGDAFFPGARDDTLFPGGGTQPRGPDGNLSAGNLALFTPNPFATTESGTDGSTLVFGSAEGNAELLLATLLVGVVGDSGFSDDEEAPERPPGEDFDEAIEQRLDGIAGAVGPRSLLGRLNDFVSRVLKQKNPSSEMLKLRDYLLSEQGQAELASTQALLAELDRLRQAFPMIVVVADRVVEFFAPPAPAGGKPTESPKPNILDDFLTPDPTRMTPAPSPEAPKAVSAAPETDRLRLNVPMTIAALFLGAIALRTDRETPWRSRSATSRDDASRRKRPAPPEGH